MNASLAGEFQVERMEFVHHAFDGEAFFDEGLSVATESFSEFWFRGERDEGFREACRVAGRNEEAGLVVEADFAGSIAIVGNDGSGGGERLGQRAWDAFAGGEVDEGVLDADERRDLRWRDEAGEDEMIFQVHGPNFFGETFAPRTAAYEEELDLRTAANDPGRGVNQVVVAFELEEAGDLSHDEIVRLESVSRAKVGVVGGGEEGFERKTAEDAGELIRVADACLEELLRHRVRDGDEVRGASGGVTLGGGEDEVGKRALKRAKRRAVNGVDDDGNTGAFRRQPAKDARLAAVGVNDVRPAVAEHSSEFAQCQPIMNRMNGADEMTCEP